MKPDCDCPKGEMKATYLKCPHWQPFGAGPLSRLARRLLGYRS